ncbi:Trk system potassium transporter TrkA [Marinobacter lutaoensis]|jgi:trk system potassium uptake protein TrkA|uniref:Trk system potassium uptake protein TrkA n=2 Tax=Marinobacter TaxID=2742 RepID=A0A1V2DUZ1_9GAMM|nr:Trk system potassium transporter TrkA [Marinobacter lutaoensis]MBE02987.1 Trk system potassium transporter TrkA [Marinobacter sp.]MBI43986.1 Trk system potassium transporter TrkA [Oceanospirillales bacterium]NVD34316.1 Trk system potassium transporter TrkA [Marinobacter lutaoensis]ONF44458.1 Trk system potassium transport protein TrkA [Marinobacter lutaoensis]|tara:strand:- start:3294 stop:4685 length:1392 start_codon:yes stop_codon:yes gene_type:complete
MKILILGAGQVGGTLAENLANEANDITVIDSDGARLRELQDRLDIRTVQGKASYPTILRAAGAPDADMVIAVTNSDETNMVACQVSKLLYKTPTTICRVRANAYLAKPELFANKDSDSPGGFPIDVLISPEHLVTKHITRLIEYPGALQVLEFSKGLARLVAIQATKGGPLVGHELSYLRNHMPRIDTRVAAIFRKDRAIMPQGDTVIEDGDEVFFIAATDHIRSVMSELQPLEKPYKRIFICGGGNIGHRLANTLESRYHVKLLERDHDRCVTLSENLRKTVVLEGDAANKDILLEENIENTDVFCAVTNDDEANIMASLLAKRLGARKVLTLINNPDYVDLIQGGEIDVAISPQQTTIGSLLTHVRRGDVVNVYSLRRGAAEAIEAIAHGDHRSSKVVGRRLDEINLPEGTTIGAIVRHNEVLIAHDHLRVQPDDHVILFLVDKSRVRDVEKLFQVGLTFF